MAMISIIMPAFNAENTITESIKSVMSQTYSDWELIVCDDCSTDNTMQIITGLANIDNRIVVVKNLKNSGPAMTRNRAINCASGRYITFLDSDDIWFDNFLDEQYRFIKRSGAAFVYSGYEIVDKDTNALLKVFTPKKKKVSFDDILYTNPISCLTAFYDSQITGKVLMPNYGREDLGCWLRLLTKTDFAFCNPKTLAAYRIGRSSVSSNKLKVMCEQWTTVRAESGRGYIICLYYIFAWAYNGFRKYHSGTSR